MGGLVRIVFSLARMACQVFVNLLSFVLLPGYFRLHSLMAVCSKSKKVKTKLKPAFAVDPMLLGLLGLPGREADDPAPPAAYTDARTFIENLKFSGTILIAKNEHDLLRSGFGKVNRASGEPNAIGTKFRLEKEIIFGGEVPPKSRCSAWASSKATSG